MWKFLLLVGEKHIMIIQNYKLEVMYYFLFSFFPFKTNEILHVW